MDRSVIIQSDSARSLSLLGAIMNLIDYNGTGRWSRDSILQRYEDYSGLLKIANRLDLSPIESSGEGKHWIYPVMDKVIEGIEQGDPACTEIGIEFIEEDASFSFGMILKTNTARALRRTTLSAEQEDRVRRRVVDMLVRGYLPREFRQYAKLAKKIGLGTYLLEITERADLTNPWVVHYYNLLKDSEFSTGHA